jgi:hypothetical protein
MMDNNSTMLKLDGIFNCHGSVQSSTVTIWLGFCKILLQFTSTMLADDDQNKKQAKEMKKINEKLRENLR